MVEARARPALTSGRLLALNRYPVKSMAGEALERLRFDERGVAGDRTHALLFFHKGSWRHLTARQAPRLLAWSASYSEADIAPAAPPLPMLRAPDGTRYRWDDPQLRSVLEADLGRPVRLRRDLGGQQDLPRSLLLTTEASHRAMEGAVGGPLDLRRFRTNLHVQLDCPAFAEECWRGATLRVGQERFELLHPCERCVIPTRDPDTQERWPELLRWLHREHDTLFGINARGLAGGEVRVGSRVEVVA